MEDWLKKCLVCQHCYVTRDEGDDAYKCRCRDKKCHFKEIKKRKAKNQTEN